MSFVASIMPFFPHGDTETALRLFNSAVEAVRECSDEVWVIQDGVDIINESSMYHLVTLERNSGKASAVQHGLRQAIESPKADVFAVCDWDDEQDIHDLPVLINTLNKSYNVVIGNRYAFFSQSETPEHRLVANYIQKLLALRLGFEATDLVSGLAVCDRIFADIFVRFSKTRGFGIGFDWMVLAFLHGKTLANAPIHAKMRSPSTKAGKLIEDFGVPLHYTEELEARGRDDVVAFCRHLVNALSGKYDSVSLQPEVIGGKRPCVAVRSNDSCSFSFL